MKMLLTDASIFAGILGFVACAMFLPPKTMCRLEKNKGVVFYDAPITKGQATKVLNTLVDTGVFNGQKIQTHLLKSVIEDGERIVNWSMITDPNYASVLSDHLLRSDVVELHSMIFSNNRVLVEITDEVVADDDETQQVRTDWGSVFYDSPSLKQAAERVARLITQSGGYLGTIRMQIEGRNTKYQVKRDPASLKNVRDSVAAEMQALVMEALPEEKVRVFLIDENLQPLKQKNGDLVKPLIDPLEKRIEFSADE